MKVKLTKLFAPICALVLFALAFSFLSRKLGTLSWHDVYDKFTALPQEAVILAFLFTALSYITLTFYDVLALRYIHHPLAYTKIAMASFVGYTFSHNLGWPVLTGGAARYRLFSAWGLSGTQIAQAVGFSGVVFWLGFCALTGLVMLIDPPSLPAYPQFGLWPIGVFCLALVFGYFYFFNIKKGSVRINVVEFAPPPVRLSATAILVAAIDWVFATCVAWVLFPLDGMTFLEFSGLFLLAQFGGIISHVPGGLGIIESFFLWAAPRGTDLTALTGALLAYRITYFIIPLGVSFAIMVLHESILYKRFLSAVSRQLKNKANDAQA